MSSRGSSFTGNFESLAQSRVARGLEPEPLPTVMAQMQSFDLTSFDEMASQVTPLRGVETYRNYFNRYYRGVVDETADNIGILPTGEVSWTSRGSSVNTKPTVREVELSLGVNKDMWDAVDPEDLIEAIYNLSISTNTKVDL